jgi:osmoprotectant transport system substrate-binding protein
MIALAGLGLAMIGCGGDGDDAPASGAEAVRIGAFNFPESELVAEIYAQALEDQGVPVERLGRIGSREVVQPALELGLIDVVPEYAGTMLSFVNLGTNAPSSDSAATIEELRATLEPRGMVALEPANAQNKNAVVVARTFAAEHGLREVSDLAPIAAELTVGGPVECPERPFCLVGLEDVYQLEFDGFVPMPSSSVVSDALFVGEVDVGVVFSTDPVTVDAGIALLFDDRGLQPAENIVPVVRRDALERWGSQLAEALNEVSNRLDTSDLALLNLRAGEPDADIAALAAQWLAA